MTRIFPPQGAIPPPIINQNEQILGTLKTSNNTLDDGIGNIIASGGISTPANNGFFSQNIRLWSDTGTGVYLYNNVNGGGFISLRPAVGSANPFNMELNVSASGTYSTDSSGNPRNYLDDGTGNAVVAGTLRCKTNATGSGSASLGANCPATTVSAPYTWIKMISSDGSTVYVPAWK
jgi:hypothetical protein